MYANDFLLFPELIWTRTENLVCKRLLFQNRFTQGSPEKRACVKQEGHPSSHGVGEDRRGATREAQRVREAGREGVQDARTTRTVRVNTATRGAENCAVGNRHGQAWRKSRGAG